MEDLDQTGCSPLKGHKLPEVKLTKHQVALMNGLPERYPTTDLTYPEVYASIVEPKEPDDFRLPTIHKRRGFWETLKDAQSESMASSALPRYTKDNFRKFLSPGHRLAHVILKRETGVNAGRKLCITHGGFMGLVPKNSEPEDDIALFWGAAVPFVIRSHGNHYQLIGECYIYGIMDGEALTDLDESRVENFLIC